MARKVRSFAARRSALRRSILGALVCVALAASDARGQVDISGPWRVVVDLPTGAVEQSWHAVQTGAPTWNLDVTITTVSGFSLWMGTIEPMSGRFDIGAPSSSGCFGADFIRAVANPSSTVFTGTLYVLQPPGCAPVEFAVEGRRCGNGVLDPGEQCDDGNWDDGDCCSSTCQFDPPSTSCNDGNACTAGEHCDGAGACVGGTCQVGPPAMTCNVCGQVCTQPQPGVCKCG